jgi:hypothetical protein
MKAGALTGAARSAVFNPLTYDTFPGMCDLPQASAHIALAWEAGAAQVLNALPTLSRDQAKMSCCFGLRISATSSGNLPHVSGSGPFDRYQCRASERAALHNETSGVDSETIRGDCAAKAWQRA